MQSTATITQGIIAGYGWLRAHPEIYSAITLGLYHAGSAFVGSLEMPTATSSAWYRFLFAFTNRLAANYSRASAANGPAGEK